MERMLIILTGQCQPMAFDITARKCKMDRSETFYPEKGLKHNVISFRACKFRQNRNSTNTQQTECHHETIPITKGSGI